MTDSVRRDDEPPGGLTPASEESRRFPRYQDAGSSGAWMSRIKRVAAFPLGSPEPHDHNNTRYITLARVETEEGAVGWGECISQFVESALSVKIVIERGYAPLLVGEDAIDVERLWHKMLSRIWWYGPQGIAAFAVSAVDLALWDLKGKLLNLPVCRLLGGQLHDRVQAMASIHFSMVDLDWTVNEFRH